MSSTVTSSSHALIVAGKQIAWLSVSILSCNNLLLYLWVHELNFIIICGFCTNIIVTCQIYASFVQELKNIKEIKYTAELLSLE